MLDIFFFFMLEYVMIYEFGNLYIRVVCFKIKRSFWINIKNSKI